MESQVATLPRRELLRQRERLSRTRRLDKLNVMHRQVRLLEQSALALLISPNDDQKWTEFLDPDVMKLWTTQRQTGQLKSEIQRLKSEHEILQRILTDRELARRTVEDLLVKTSSVGEWERKVIRWRRRAQLHYRVLTLDDFDRHVRASFREMREFELGMETQATDANVMGWDDHRRVVEATHTLRFSSTKILRNIDPQRLKDHIWALYADPQVYADIVLGGRANSSQEVHQHILASAQLMRCVEIYDQRLSLCMQYLYLHFRVETENGYIQFFRTIAPEELSAVEKDKSSVWPTIFYWIRVDNMSPCDVRVSVQGRIHSEDPALARFWCTEELSVMVRSEEIITGRPLLSF